MADIGNRIEIEERYARIGRGFDTLDEWSTNVTPEKERARDLRTIEAMEKFGGEFVRKLGAAARVADPSNLSEIKKTFCLYWSRYEAEAGRRLLGQHGRTTGAGSHDATVSGR